MGEFLPHAFFNPRRPGQGLLTFTRPAHEEGVRERSRPRPGSAGWKPAKRNPAGKMPTLPERRHGPARLRFAGRSLPYRLHAAPILRPRPGSAGFQPAQAGTLRARCPRSQRGVTVLHVYALPTVPFPTGSAPPQSCGLALGARASSPPSRNPAEQDAHAPGEASRSCTSTPCRPFPSLPAPRRPNLAASPWERGLPARQAGTLRARCPRSRRGVTVLHVYALPAVPFPTGSTPVLHGKGPQFASRANRRMMPTREEKRPWSWKIRRRQHAGNGGGMKTLPPARRSQPRRPRSGA